MVQKIRVAIQEQTQPAESKTRFHMVSDGFNDFCQKTSLHGWQYLASAKSWSQIGFWTVVVLVSLAIGVAFTYHSTMEYVNSGTITSISSTTAPLDDITFPDIVICNVNHVTSSFLRSIDILESDEKDTQVLFKHFLDGFESDQEEQHNHARLQKILERMKTVHQWNESINFYTLGNHKCNDMILSAQWKQDHFQPENRSFSSVTDFGSCCEINPFLHYERNLTESQTTNEDWLNIPTGFTRNGIHNGLTVLLDAETFDYASAFHGNPAQGFRAAVSDANEKPVILHQGFNINTGIELLATMDMTMYSTTADALGLEPQIRDCYSTDELPLKYFNESDAFRYSMRNCLYDVVLEKILTHCNCSPDFAGNRNLMIPCRGSNLTCAKKWERNIGNPNYQNEDLTKIYVGRPKACLQNCQDQVTQMSLTHSLFPNQKNFPFNKEFCLAMKKIVKVCMDPYRKVSFEESYGSEITCQQILDAHNQDNMCKGRLAGINNLQKHKLISKFLHHYAHENLAYVKFYIRDAFYTKIARDKAVTTITFIGNTGGLLGLSMGFSFVTICEILHHVFKYLMKALSIKKLNLAEKKRSFADFAS